MTGASIAHYTITEKIGQGGMGEVYRATDTKLKRDVALKILPESFTQFPERLARFRREAEVLASLNHPGIGTIYGLEETSTSQVLVLELVEGEDLAERISRGPIPLEEAIDIALQIAQAVEAAHEKGIVHRDLKPANVKITPNGQVKVLDFGLAKVFDEERPDELANSPTLTAAATQAGIILGTAAYMSPEQARGKSVDRRSDIWSFGVVLWEMLVGRTPFGGETISDVLAAILKETPAADDLPKTLPPALGRLLSRCLERDLTQRLQWIGDARLELTEAQRQLSQGDQQQAPEATRIRRPWLELLPWVLAGLSMFALLVSWFRTAQEQPGDVPSYTWTLPPPEGTSFVVNQGAPALSSDGRTLVFVAKDNQGRRQLWLRRMDQLESRSLPGTTGATYPFWSPDGRWIAYFSGMDLMRIDASGGQSEKIATIGGEAIGGTWGADGTILSASAAGYALFRVTPAGDVTQFTFDVEGREWHGMPWFLPDGRQFLVTLTDTGGGRGGVFVGDLDGNPITKLSSTVTAATYAAGKLIYWEKGTVRAVSFDPSTREMTGSPSPIAEDVALSSLSTQAFLAAGETLLVYLHGAPVGPGVLAWLDRNGQELRVVADNADYYRPRLSPDGSELAVDVTSPNSGSGDIWRFDTERGTALRVTSDSGNESYPIWSPNGRELIYFKGPAIYRQVASGTEPEALILGDQTMRVWPSDWSPDGKQLLYHRGSGPGSGADLWILDLESGETTPWIVNEAFTEEDATFSPDGKWVAYTSNESGRFEIYLQDFPDRRERIPVSRNGGTGPRWSGDGSELFFYSPGRGGIVAVQLSKGPELNPGIPELLFEINLRAIGGNAFYDVSSDGKRFLVTRFADQTDPGPMIVRSGWAQSETISR